ncbi:MAG TPA: family 16 glycoside hydrolase, partial [Terriglobia bacterium]|nr:family 16 glycoside hydrolase [Terriglobia bacterium]
MRRLISLWLGRPEVERRVKVLGLGIMAFALLFPPAGAADDAFRPLIGSPTFDHWLGDKEYWSLRDGVLTAGKGAALDHSKFLISVERFGNFMLKFQVRSGGRALAVLMRATIQPPGQLVGYEAEVGSQQAGSLCFRQPGPMFIPLQKEEPGHAAPGFPDAVGIP